MRVSSSRIQLLCFLFFLLIFSACKEKEPVIYSAYSPDSIRYTGRVKVNADSSVTFNWSGVYIETIFIGGRVSIRATDTRNSYYNIFIDDEFQQIIEVTPKDSIINLASNLSKDPHTLRIQKRSEGKFGTTTIESFLLSSSGSLILAPNKVRLIEFIGDSFTCGYGTDGTDLRGPFRIKEENCNKSFAPILARYFDADYVLTAHSGIGAARNYGDKSRTSSRTMKDMMLYTLDGNLSETWNFKDYTPNLVVINLGTNDFSTKPIPNEDEFLSAYRQIIDQCRVYYGNVPILCIVPPAKASIEYFESLKTSNSVGNVYFTAPLAGIIHNDDMGGSWHPGYRANKKKAMFIAPYISTIMNWEAPERAFK